MRTPLSVRTIIRGRLRHGWLIVISFAVAAAVMGIGGSAGAAPMPTVAQVKAKLAKLEARAGKLSQQYDQVVQQLKLATQRLDVLNQETARYRSTFEALRKRIGKLAAVAYEQGGIDSPLGLLTSSSPGHVLRQASILNELSVAGGAQIRQYIAASRQLLGARQAAARERAGIVAIKQQLGKRLAVLNSMKQQQATLLAELTPAQQAGVGPGGGGGGTYHGPTSTQAEKAVAFAYKQLGCPYVYAGTGPCNMGFDCSGLTMSAWAYAGISIPRVSYDQMTLPRVPLHTTSGAFTLQYLHPGDILGFAANSHVGIYVGNGYLIDSPVPGRSVEKVAVSGWYRSELDGAVRP